MNNSQIPVCTIPGHIRIVLSRIWEKGHMAFLVGGCVRDAIIGRPIHDWDIATSASPEAIAGIFPKTALIGARYGTVSVVLPEVTVEVTTFRSDGEYNDGRHPDSVEFVGSLNEDLSRRDFTMNAIAASADGMLTDPFGGFEDIQNRIIRCVGVPDVRYREDSLRMLRAFRFSAELGFTIEPSTLAAIHVNADRMKLVSAERVRVELEKTIMAQRPEIAGDIIMAGLLDAYIGQGELVYGNHPVRYAATPPQRGMDAGDEDCAVAEADLLTPFERIASLPAEPVLRWCAFCTALIDMGLIQSCAAFLTDLRLDAKTVKSASSGIAILMSSPNPEIIQVHDRAQIKRLLAKNGVDAVRCAAAAVDAIFNNSTVSLLSLTDEIIASGECFSPGGLAVSGHDLISLGYRQGAELGKVLDMLLEHVIERPEDNTREFLLSLVG